MNTELKERIENTYDVFFGKGYWENQYKSHIVEFAKQCVEQELSRLREIDIENAAKHYAMTNYARAEKQSIEDASYIQDVSYHTFKGAIDWLKKLSLEEKIIEGAEASTTIEPSCDAPFKDNNSI